MFDLGIQISQITAGHQFRKLGEKVYVVTRNGVVTMSIERCYISKALCAIYWLCQTRGQIAVKIIGINDSF